MRAPLTRRPSYLVVLLAAALLSTFSCGGQANEKGASNPTAQSTVVDAGDTTGVTDTEIKLGTHFPLSQNPAAAYAPISFGMKAFFDYINLQGGVYGRRITFIIGDDHYNPPDTVEVVRKLVEQDKVFAIVGGLGEATHDAVWKYLEEKGVPDMYMSTGLAKWTDPVARSRFGSYPDYVTEGTVLGQYIAENYNGKKLGILRQSDEMGEDGEEGLRKGIEGSDVEVTSVQQYDVLQSDVTAQAQRLKNDGVEVIAVYAIPPQAASLVKATREVLNWDVPIIVSGINQSDIFVALAGPQNAEGVVSCVIGHQAYETELPGIQKYERIWAKTGTGGPLSNFAVYGISIAEAVVWDLEMAGPDLTRDSFLDAAESMCNVYCSTCRGIAPWTTSPTDHRMNQAEQINIVRDGKWVTVGDPVSYESTPNCTPPTPPAGFEDQPKVGEDAEYVDVP
jgi:ABC-type branched-subunit amino acid transport system substrate-binding protein